MGEAAEKIVRARALCGAPLKLGDVVVDAHVLPDGRRVISQRAIVRALTGGAGTGDLRRYLDRLPNASASLPVAPEIEFEMTSGVVAIGRDAIWFVDMLRAYKSAWRDGHLKPSQVKLAQAADRMLDALATVGIVAMIDEATGYQFHREHESLQRLYAKALLTEPAEWSRFWPDDVVRSLCKTYGIQYKRPGEFPAPMMGVAGWIHRLVLGRDVYDELKRRKKDTPRSVIPHTFISPDTKAVLSSADMHIIRAFSEQSKDKYDFMRRMVAHYRREGFQLAFGEDQ